MLLRIFLYQHLVRNEGEYWFAEIEFLNVIGEGNTPAGALDDLTLHIDHFLDFYTHQANENLTQFAQELKNCYEKIAYIG